MPPTRRLALLLALYTAGACASHGAPRAEPASKGAAARSSTDEHTDPVQDGDHVSVAEPEPEPVDPPALAEAPDAPPAVPWAVAEADALRPLVHTAVARAFLDAARALPAGRARTLQRDTDGRWLDESELADVPQQARSAVVVTADSYYVTKYGSPLAYVRVLERLGDAGLGSLRGKRVLDFGAGTVGHLRLLALAGADAVGVDVDPFLAALYAQPGASGEVDRFDASSGGSARLFIGSWPGDETLRDAVGAGFDVITSKNTLKRGYIHPEQEVDPRLLVHLGVDDATFLAHVHDALVPGGLFVIVNLSPAQDTTGTRYIPWADGRCPFTRQDFDTAGFDVLVDDEIGDEAARDMGRALGWDEQGMDLEHDLFEHATVVRRREP
ncbi:MAG: hypothetical protein H6828_15940 [Planctomycetes bacterium]|nr:hypothetical protein [Planctomycetota bacterium]MCB9916617.1 hypothetical protein [Planctomycetota bacterium]